METDTKLPVRMLPRRGQAVFQLIFMLFWSGFIVYWSLAFVPEFLAENGIPSLHDLNAEHFFLLIPAVMLCFGIFSLVRGILRLLPGSPYVYLVFTRDGLTWRHFGTVRQASWSEIRRFSLLREKSGKSYKWVLSVDGIPTSRDGASHFKIELGNFLSAFAGEKEAKSLTAWFNSILMLIEGGRLPDRISVPAGLVLQGQERGRTSTAVAATSSRRKSVIER